MKQLNIAAQWMPFVSSLKAERSQEFKQKFLKYLESLMKLQQEVWWVKVI